MYDNKVLYMMCPHCGASWYGKIKYEGNNCLIVEGMEDTDVAKEITCLACGNKYIPLNKSLVMWDFVAKALQTVKGS